MLSHGADDSLLGAAVLSFVEPVLAFSILSSRGRYDVPG
jgi:hypothetical protein